MKDLSTILATNSNGKDISLGEVNQWLNANNKRELAQFIYDRLYGRYIRPFDYPSDDYRLKYKNGFTIMTNCCLLIETYTSWSEPFFRSTDKKSERCFMYFFKSHDSFKDFATGSPSIKAITDLSQSVNHNGVACDFYHNCKMWFITQWRNKEWMETSQKWTAL